MIPAAANNPGGCARGALLADAPVDALAEQVSMPVMAGVLLDHVNEQLAQRDRLTLRVAAGEAEVMIAGELLGEGDLLAPRQVRTITSFLLPARTSCTRSFGHVQLSVPPRQAAV
jgi:hypothetical protein